MYTTNPKLVRIRNDRCIGNYTTVNKRIQTVNKSNKLQEERFV